MLALKVHLKISLEWKTEFLTKDRKVVILLVQLIKSNLYDTIIKLINHLKWVVLWDAGNIRHTTDNHHDNQDFT
jgi:hypothetical protein